MLTLDKILVLGLVYSCLGSSENHFFNFFFFLKTWVFSLYLNADAEEKGKEGGE